MTSKFRGAAHPTCNKTEGVKHTKNYQCPVLFHNLKGYDAHHIISEIGKHTSKLDAIAQNYEKYVTFSYSKLKYLDSAGFLQASLDTLAENMYGGGTSN